jgi:hypothetical protein
MNHYLVVDLKAKGNEVADTGANNGAGLHELPDASERGATSK